LAYAGFDGADIRCAMEWPAMTPPAVQAAHQRFDFSRAKILVVDDSAASLGILSNILLGFGVRDRRLCSTVSEAAERLSLSRVDLVIADGEMPEQDGFDLTKRVRLDPNGPNFTTPILIVSGFVPVAKVMRARDVGANLIILKPVAPGDLLSRIRWLARGDRQFVQSPGYCGPDRRLRNAPLPPGVEERRADALRLMAQPERAMSQDDIDSLFN
jgi:PleD family two-component response regulator